MNQDNISFCTYVQPIVNGCAGFIKSDGYMTHIPGVIIMMSADETMCSIIHLPVVHNVYMTSIINQFLGLKTPELQSDLLQNTYFTGYNIKYSHLINFYNIYSNIDNISKCIYHEPDCYNIQGFDTTSSSTSIDKINVSDGEKFYRIPASKSITPLTKSDSASLRLYEYIYDTSLENLKTVRYTVYKKKFNLSVDIYSNIIAV